MMRKTILLSISFLFTSVNATDVSEAEVMRVAAELAQDTEFVQSVRVLCEQELESERVIELLMQSDEMQAYARNTHYQRNQRSQRRREMMISDAISITTGAFALLVLAILAWRKYVSEESDPSSLGS